MGVRVDHAAESQKVWEHVGEDFIAEEGWTEATAIMSTLDALRHATLALVEQQRIANRIALAAHELQVHGRVMVTDHGILDNPEHVDGYLNVKPEIKAALS